MEEKELHSLIKSNISIQKKLIECLGIDSNSNFSLISEDQFPNGMMVDFTLKIDDEVRALIELKGDEIGINDFVRGTGQVFQYQNFIDYQYSIKQYVFNDAFTVYLFPSSIVSSGKFNIGLLCYPSKCKLVEYVEDNQSFREITKKELVSFAGVQKSKAVTVSQYYIRDNRLFELYIALRYVCLFFLQGKTKLNRKEMEAFLSTLNVPNKGNWRNAFISLSSLGLTTEDNVPTAKGYVLGGMEFCQFAYSIYDDYIRRYLDLITQAIKDCGGDKQPVSLDDIKKQINSYFSDQTVLFLTDSGNRYISSWLNIMQDDFGCVSFEKNKTKRIYSVVYRIDELNKKAIISRVSKNVLSRTRVDEFLLEYNKNYCK